MKMITILLMVMTMETMMEMVDVDGDGDGDEEKEEEGQEEEDEEEVGYVDDHHHDGDDGCDDGYHDCDDGDIDDNSATALAGQAVAKRHRSCQLQQSPHLAFAFKINFRLHPICEVPVRQEARQDRFGIVSGCFQVRKKS